MYDVGDFAPRIRVQAVTTHELYFLILDRLYFLCDAARALVGVLIEKLSDSKALQAAHSAFPHSPGLITIADRLCSSGIDSLLHIPISAAAGTSAAAAAAAAGTAAAAAAAKAKGLDFPELQSCILPLTAEITYGRMTADISNLKFIPSACLLAFVQLVALSPSVVRVGVSSRPQLTNYEARGVTQVLQLYLLWKRVCTNGDLPCHDSYISSLMRERLVFSRCIAPLHHLH